MRVDAGSPGPGDIDLGGRSSMRPAIVKAGPAECEGQVVVRRACVRHPCFLRLLAPRPGPTSELPSPTIAPPRQQGTTKEQNMGHSTS